MLVANDREGVDPTKTAFSADERAVNEALENAPPAGWAYGDIKVRSGVQQDRVLAKCLLRLEQAGLLRHAGKAKSSDSRYFPIGSDEEPF